jgi:Uma2 family endonuclease
MERAVGDSAIVRVRNPLHLGRYDEPQPDLALVSPPSSKYRTRHPEAADVLLVVEVAESRLRFDRDVKLGLYARAGVPEVWLIDLKAGQIVRCGRPASAGYRESEPLGDLAAVPVPGLESAHLDLARLL